MRDREISGVGDFPVLHFLSVFDFIFHFYQLFLVSCLFVNSVVCGAVGNKMRPLKFDNKQYYFRNIFKNIPTNKIFKVSLIKIVKSTY